MNSYMITGATSGLGREFVFQILDEPDALILVSWDIKELEKLKKEIISIKSNIIIELFDVDLSQKDGAVNIIRKFEAQKNITNVKVLLNSAARFTVAPISLITEEIFDQDFQLNVVTPFFLAKYFGELMAQKGGGYIVNIGSSSAYGAAEHTSTYCITKHALLGLSRSFQIEWRKFGVRSLFVAPGSMQTKMGEQVVGQDPETFIDPKEAASVIKDLIKYNGNMVADEVRLNRMNYR